MAVRGMDVRGAREQNCCTVGWFLTSSFCDRIVSMAGSANCLSLAGSSTNDGSATFCSTRAKRSLLQLSGKILRGEGAEAKGGSLGTKVPQWGLGAKLWWRSAPLLRS